MILLNFFGLWIRLSCRDHHSPCGGPFCPSNFRKEMYDAFNFNYLHCSKNPTPTGLWNSGPMAQYHAPEPNFFLIFVLTFTYDIMPSFMFKYFQLYIFFCDILNFVLDECLRSWITSDTIFHYFIILIYKLFCGS